MGSELKRDQTKRIWKFAIPLDDCASIEMPKDAEILHVETQCDTPCMWALVKTDAPKELRIFYVVGTGHPMPTMARKHVGTFQMQGGALVFHLFE